MEGEENKLQAWWKSWSLEKVGTRSIFIGALIIFIVTQATDNEALKIKQLSKIIVHNDTTRESIYEVNFNKIKSITLSKGKDGKVDITIINN